MKLIILAKLIIFIFIFSLKLKYLTEKIRILKDRIKK